MKNAQKLILDIAITSSVNDQSTQNKPVSGAQSQYFDSLKAAFQEMMTIDVYRLDPALCQRKGVTSYFSRVAIRDEQQGIVAEIMPVRSRASSIGVPEPGMYLRVPMGLPELEQQTGIPLKSLDFYDEWGAYALLSNYNRTFDKLIPCSGYTELAADCRKALLMPACGEPATPYLLHVKGTDYSQLLHDDAKFGYRQFQDYRHFPDFNTAFASLIKEDIRSFHPSIVNLNQLGRCNEETAIRHLSTDENLLITHIITFDESPDGMPPAGLYLHFPKGIDSLPADISCHLALFNDYDCGIPHLLLGHLKYDNGYSLTPAAGYDQFMANMLQEQYPFSPEKDQAYQLRFHVRYLPPNEPDKKNRYEDRVHTFHYLHQDQALLGLLKTDLLKMDEHLCHQHRLDSYITHAAVCDQAGMVVASLHAVTYNQGPNMEQEPGIYLKLNTAIAELENQKGIDLALPPLKDWNLGQHQIPQDPYRQIANYTTDQQHLLINQGLYFFQEQLREQIEARAAMKETAGLTQPAPSPTTAAEPPSPEQDPYQLRLYWMSSRSDLPAGEPSTSHPVIEGFKDFTAAFEYLQEYDETHFDREKMRAMPYGDTYLQYAAICDAADGREIMSKFMLPQQNNQMPGGVCVKLNQDKLSLPTLKAIRKHLVEIEDAGSLHYLIYKSKPKEPSTAPQTTAEKKNREVKDHPGKGKAK